MRIAIVKTSSLGDIVQAFVVLDALRARFPHAQIDWVVESRFHPIVAAHPKISRAIAFDVKKMTLAGLRALRQEYYDSIFDLQGNCKSALIVLAMRGRVKIGYGFRTVREWPNILATHVRYHVSKNQNIRQFYLEPVGRFCGITLASSKVRLCLTPEQQERFAQMKNLLPKGEKIMICPGSKWPNKQLGLKTWIDFLKSVPEAFFLLMWGEPYEKAFCEAIAAEVSNCKIIDKLPLPVWQNLMYEVDCVIGVDSSALHLCATTDTASIGLFGPTSPAIFQPVGNQHLTIHGSCPYGVTFLKQCPRLRYCPTGACIKSITAEQLKGTYLLHKKMEGCTERIRE